MEVVAFSYYIIVPAWLVFARPWFLKEFALELLATSSVCGNILSTTVRY